LDAEEVITGSMLTMEIYYYTIYGINICCNVKMPLLYEHYGNAGFDLILNIYYGYENRSEITKIEKDNDNVYNIFLSKYAKYRIDIINNRIDCNAENFEAFFSTLFNIPFSVYFFLKKEKLLHACSMLREDSLFCFTGGKGIGKSTLTHLLNGKEFKLYSDDTVRETAEGYGIRAHNLVKLTDETIENLRITDILRSKNVMGKTYKKNYSKSYPAVIKTIIQLYRTEGIVKLEKINDEKIIRLIYIDNIVGTGYFKKELLKDICKIIPPKNILFYKLIIPDTISRLEDEKDDIKNLLMNIQI
jgi:dephospho-CoA kinase